MHQKGITWLLMLSCHHGNQYGEYHYNHHGNIRHNHHVNHNDNHHNNSLTARMDWQQLKSSDVSPCLEKDMLPALLVCTTPSPQQIIMPVSQHQLYLYTLS